MLLWTKGQGGDARRAAAQAAGTAPPRVRGALDEMRERINAGATPCSVLDGGTGAPSHRDQRDGGVP
eukprot:gene13073-7857_t